MNAFAREYNKQATAEDNFLVIYISCVGSTSKVNNVEQEMAWHAHSLRTSWQQSKTLFGARIPTTFSTGRTFLVSSKVPKDLERSNTDQNSFKTTSQGDLHSQPFGFQPFGEPGSGTYGKQQPVIYCLVDAIKERVLETIEPLANESSVLFSIGDYGTADGASTFGLIGDIIGKVRERSPSRPVQVVYEDQPSNDYNSLFRRLHGEISDPPSYLQKFTNVFTTATATGFYKQCVPDSSMDVIFSSLAMHWLSRRATVLQNAIFHFCEVSQEEERLFKEQAVRDWETILLHRAKELKRGGVFIASLPVRSLSASNLGHRFCFQDIFLCIEDTWRRFKESGKITQEEYINSNNDAFSPTSEAMLAPFESADSPVRRAGLSLMDFQKVLVPCPFKAEYWNVLEKSGVDDRARIARKMVYAARAIINSTLINGLNPQRSNKQEVVDSFYDEMVDSIENMNFDTMKTEWMMGITFVKKE